MPTYQYACTECREELEAVQTFTDAPLTECPACGGRLRKVYSAVGVVFKGSGFYKNDSRAPAAKESSDSGSSDSGSSDKGASDSKEKTSGDKVSSGDKGGESKPAAKPKESAPAAAGSSSGAKSPSAA